VADEASVLAAPWRARTILLGLIAGLGVPMVVVGLAGSLYASIRRRTRDIAVRMALGATVRDVSGGIVGHALAVAAAGVAIGLAAAVSIGRVLSGVLFGVSPTDPLTLAGVAGLMLTVALVASVLPARLAASIAPIDALRER
jgi:ABC-type antimicrobial peptide transport system permease subunit